MGDLALKDLTSKDTQQHHPAAFLAETNKVVKDVESCLNDRFNNFLTNPLLTNAHIPSGWPDGEEDLKEYGIEELDFLLHHFKEVLQAKKCCVADARQQWKHLKLFCPKHYPNQSYLHLWKSVFQNKKAVTRYGNALHIVAIILTYPISYAKLERAFSAMRRIHNDERASLKTPTVNDLLTIMMDGPEVETVDSMPAVKVWIVDVGGNIRPNKRKKKSTAADGSAQPGPAEVEAGDSHIESESDMEESEIEDDDPEEDSEEQVEQLELLIETVTVEMPIEDGSNAASILEII